MGINLPNNKTSLTNHLYFTGFFRLLQKTRKKTLTVLNYHRVDDINRENFDTFKPNISATPLEFDLQMGLLNEWFNVVSLSDLIGFLYGLNTIPPYAVLITFDDGYLDNYVYAHPILEKYHFPAVIFLTAGHIGYNRAFFWDLIAYCIYHTEHNQLDLHGFGKLRWDDNNQKDAAVHKLVKWMKQLKEDEKQELASSLPVKNGRKSPNPQI